ncbi:MULTISPECIES: GNAT family N-acetyltransferase [unclassified Saccharothrix]|uniref:GNAT family N-acetyltransferase n=1 Tax=unclassified Saccharothrix TaxID=2593673 RepID=UPI00307ECC31
MVTLSGYRPAHAALLKGRWLPGELIAVREDRRVADFSVAELPEPGLCDETRVLVAAGAGVVRYLEIDWVDRRARLEVLLLTDYDEVGARALLERALETAFSVFALNRVYGYVTPGGPDVEPVLRAAGFEREGVVPEAARVGGAPVGRTLWGRLRESR